jgi:hypothetical protein
MQKTMHMQKTIRMQKRSCVQKTKLSSSIMHVECIMNQHACNFAHMQTDPADCLAPYRKGMLHGVSKTSEDYMMGT